MFKDANLHLRGSTLIAEFSRSLLFNFRKVVSHLCSRLRISQPRMHSLGRTTIATCLRVRLTHLYYTSFSYPCQENTARSA